MPLRNLILCLGLLVGFRLPPLAAQPNKKQSSKESEKASSNGLKVPGITLVNFPAEPTGAGGEAIPVAMGESEVYFRAGELPLFKESNGDEVSFVWQQADKKRLVRDAVAGGTVTVKYIVETDGKVKLADLSETPAEIPNALKEEILKGISRLRYAKPASVKGKPVRYVKQRAFTFLPPEETPINSELYEIENRAQGINNSQSDQTVYTFVEQMPEFKGGQAAMQQFIAENLRYPDKSRRAGVEGKVFASFIVEPDGRVSEVKIIKGLAPDMDAEVLRVMKLLYFEKAGKQNGRAVRVNYTYPVMFSLGQKK